MFGFLKKVLEDTPEVKPTRQPTCSERELMQMKVGQIARNILMDMLESGYATEAEIELMQTEDYSKTTFDLQYPLLMKVRQGEPRQIRYYARVLNIYGQNYRMCSEWYESKSNDDKMPLIKWIVARKNNNV